jgi:hypothetical protein
MMMERRRHAAGESDFAQNHFLVCSLDVVTFKSPSGSRPCARRLRQRDFSGSHRASEKRQIQQCRFSRYLYRTGYVFIDGHVALPFGAI